MALPYPLRALTSLAKDCRGASVVELAVVAPLIMVLFMGMVDTALGISQKLTLEQAAQRSIEKAAAYGQTGSDYSDVDDEAAEAAGVPVDQVEFDQWLECNNVRQQSFDGSCPEGQEIGRHISVAIHGAYIPIFSYGPVAQTVGANGDQEFPINVEASVRIQ